MSDSEQPPETARHGHHDHGHDHAVDGPGYATPQSAVEQADREKTAYVMGLYVGTDVDAPDVLAVVDVDPDSDTDAEVVDRLEMPNRGDELHHFGSTGASAGSSWSLASARRGSTSWTQSSGGIRPSRPSSSPRANSATARRRGR